MKEPQFWISGLTGHIYMTQAWRDLGGGCFECTGKKYDVTDAVLKIAEQHRKHYGSKANE